RTAFARMSARGCAEQPPFCKRSMRRQDNGVKLRTHGLGHAIHREVETRRERSVPSAWQFHVGEDRIRPALYGGPDKRRGTERRRHRFVQGERLSIPAFD